MIDIGDNVKMSEDVKKLLIENDCKEHVDEFGDCEGVVIGQTFEDNFEDDIDYVDVRWKPSELKYGYHKNQLVKI
jgi:hypothetical protein